MHQILWSHLLFTFNNVSQCPSLLGDILNLRNPLLGPLPAYLRSDSDLDAAVGEDVEIGVALGILFGVSD